MIFRVTLLSPAVSSQSRLIVVRGSWMGVGFRRLLEGLKLFLLETKLTHMAYMWGSHETMED